MFGATPGDRRSHEQRVSFGLCVLLTLRRNLSCCRYALVRTDVMDVEVLLNVPSIPKLPRIATLLIRASLDALRSSFRTGLEV